MSRLMTTTTLHTSNYEERERAREKETEVRYLRQYPGIKVEQLRNTIETIGQKSFGIKEHRL
jgi:hypothetical protein